MTNIYFARKEMNGLSIWSYDLANNFLSNYTKGINPYPLKTKDQMLCTRFDANGKGEIWMINFGTGAEECILSDAKRSFSSPAISPDGQWILLVGSNVLMNGSSPYANTDIFVCHTDGTQLRQLTYHAADDLSPVWSRDGKHIYFISQRGSSTATANVWRMTFNRY
jgi:Tol biopolymer transport system component